RGRRSQGQGRTDRDDRVAHQHGAVDPHAVLHGDAGRCIEHRLITRINVREEGLATALFSCLNRSDMTDTLIRCAWAGSDPMMCDYHDTEWGVPERDSRALWEKLILDGFQAGLSWSTILRKREAFREAFEGFDPERIARYDAAKVDRL